MAETSGRATPQGGTRVALIGAGYIADTHLEVLAQLPGVAPVGVFDVDAARAAALVGRHRTRFPQLAAYATLDELVARAQPAVAHVLVPPPLHAGVASELVNRGVGVLVEKPLAISAADAKALVERARAHGVALAVNHNETFHPSFLELKRIVADGAIGRPEHVFACLNVPLRQLKSRDFSHWMFRAPQNIVFEQATHPLSQIFDLIGPCRRAAAVAAPARLLAPGIPFHDSWQLALTCARGTASLYLGFGREFPESFLRVLGQDGSVQVDLLRGHVMRLRKTPWPDFVDQWWNARAASLTLRRDAWRRAFDYVASTLRMKPRTDLFFAGMAGSLASFHASLRGGPFHPNGGEQGLAVVEACELATAAVARAAAPAASAPSAEPAAPAASAPAASAGAPPVVVTGAAGFLGRHLVARILAEGVGVRALVRRPAFAPAALRRAGIEIREGDAADPAAVGAAVKGARAVVHLATAAGDGREAPAVAMVRAARTVAEACVAAGVKRLVFTSSIAVYDLGDERDAVVTEESPLDPKPGRRGEYARAKIESERFLAGFAGEHALELVVARPGFVVGRDGAPQHSGVGLWTRDTQVYGWGDGRRPLPFVLVEDVADALWRCVERREAAGRSFNLVGDVNLTAREWVLELRARLDRDFHFHPQSTFRWWGEELLKYAIKRAIGRRDAARPSWHDLAARGAARGFDNARAKRELGWEPAVDRTSFLLNALPER